MKALILILALTISQAGFSFASCAPKPDEPKCKHPENVYTASVDGEPVKYIGNDGKEHKCSSGHCKSASGLYNACSASAELCCGKE